jgi:hypothetical protein
MKSVFDCWTGQTNIGTWPRELKLAPVTKSFNDPLRVVTDDCVLDQVGI